MKHDQLHITRLLGEAREGDATASNRLLGLVYDELRQIARRHLNRERKGHTLQATALVHEAYIKMLGPGGGGAIEGRAHFFSLASRAMRQVLIDYARRRHADKRGGDWVRTSLDDGSIAGSFGMKGHAEDLLVLDRALDRLDALEPRLCRVVEYRFFGGMSEEEVADVLDVTARTVQRDWAKARAWLYKELYPEAEEGGLPDAT